MTPQAAARPLVHRAREPRRLVVHAHFYQPVRRDPFTGQHPAGRRPPPRSATGTRGSPPSATGPTPSGAPSAHVSWDLGPTLAAYLAGRRRPTSSPASRTSDRPGRRPRRGGPGIAQAFHHAILPLASLHDRRTEIRWGLRDFELRFGRPADGDLAAGDGGGPADAADPGRGGHRPRSSRPWQAADAHLDTRRPYRVDWATARHIVVVFYDGDLSARSRSSPPPPPTPTASPASGSRRAWPARLRRRHAADARHRHRRRAVRPPPDVPRPVPAPARRPGPDVRDRGFDVVTLGRGRRPSPGPPPPRDPDPRADVVELPPRRAALVRRVPGRARRPLEGAAARRRSSGSPAASTPSPRRSPRELPGLDDVWAARDAYVDVVFGVERGRRLRRGAAAARAPSAEDRRRLARPARGAALAPGDVRPRRLVLGRPVPPGDAPGAARRGAGGPARGRARRHGPRAAAGRRPRDAASRRRSGSTGRRSTGTRSARSGSRRRARRGRAAAATESNDPRRKPGVVG